MMMIPLFLIVMGLFLTYINASPLTRIQTFDVTRTSTTTTTQTAITATTTTITTTNNNLPSHPCVEKREEEEEEEEEKQNDSDIVKIPHCSRGTFSTQNYWLTNVPEGQYIKPSSKTALKICYEDDGLKFIENASDKNGYSKAQKCNAHVWEDGAALELFISRIGNIDDIPREYYEIDIAASGAVFGTIIHNEKGTTSTCPTCIIGELKCHGLGSFDDYPLLSHKINNPINGDYWDVERFIPFTMFDKFITIPQDEQEKQSKYLPNNGKNKYFKINTYRYDFPHGIDPDYKTYELSGGNPTWSPSFHIPKRFATIVLV